MIVADATAADGPDLVGLINAAYRQPGAAPGWTDEQGLLEGPRTDAAMVQADLTAGRVLTLRREAGGSIAACLSIAIAPDDAWYLSSIAVAPQSQNTGLGAALLGEVERQARVAGVRCLRMTVIELREALIAWYERRGFRRTGARLPFPYKDPRVGRPLRNDLDLVVLEKTL